MTIREHRAPHCTSSGATTRRLRDIAERLRAIDIPADVFAATARHAAA
jgi:hypothetical protein